MGFGEITMFENQRVLAVIPARSGSKGLPHKNIKCLAGKPMLAYTIEAAKESQVFDEIYVSTDSQEYADISKKYGGRVPFLRSYELSTDTANTWDVVREVLGKYETLNQFFDIVVVLQPTSPLRKAQDIIEGLNKMKETNGDLVISVCEPDHSPLWMNRLVEGGRMDLFFNKESGKTRQELPKYYRINGAFYGIKVKYLKRTKDIFDTNVFASIMTKERSIDVDDEIDFRFVEFLLEKYKV